MKKNLDLLTRLQNWYGSMCNGDWEHTYGVFINNVDNPGWRLKVEVIDTYLYKAPFDKVQVQREDEDDWIVCTAKDGEFKGSGGPNNLNEILEIFLNWAEANDPDRLSE